MRTLLLRKRVWYHHQLCIKIDTQIIHLQNLEFLIYYTYKDSESYIKKWCIMPAYKQLNIPLYMHSGENSEFT